MTNNHLKIKTVEPTRFGPIRLCCCSKYNINNIDLSQVQDVDITGVSPPLYQTICCCSSGKDMLNVDVGDQGVVYLTVKEGDGEAAANLIMNQIEESQQIERD